MNAVKAEVKNGRLLVDEPTDLPDGTVMYLMPVSHNDSMSAEERAELEQAIEEGAADFERGDFSDALEFAMQLAAKP